MRQALGLASKELIIVFFLPPHPGVDDIIEERSSSVDGHPEVTHFWNQYSWSRMQNFFSSLGVNWTTEIANTPGAAHQDFIVRLKK